MTRLATGLAVCLCWLCAAGQAQAPGAGRQGQPARTAVLMGEMEPELLQRVRGQTGDLSWKLVLEESAGPPDMNRAEVMGERHRAQAVIWFEAPAGGGLVVYIVEVGHGRLFTRRIEPPGEGEVHAYSATAEAAALVVRSSLMSLASGTPLGESIDAATARAETAKPENREVETGETKSATTGTQRPESGRAVRDRPGMEKTEPEKAEGTRAGSEEAGTDDTGAGQTGYAMEKDGSTGRAATGVEPEPPEGSGERSGAGLRTSVGWQIAVDGQSPAGQHALDLRLALELGRVELELLGSIGLLYARLEDDGGEFAIRVNRHEVLAGVGYALLSGDGLRLTCAAAAGMAVFYRRTEVYTEELRAKPPAYKNALVMRGGLLGQWLPWWTDRMLGLELEVAADVVPAAPVFSLQEAERVADRRRLWPVQIVAVLGLVARYEI